MTIDEAIESSMEDAQNTLSERTAKTYKTGLQQLKHFMQYSGISADFDCKEITAQFCVDYLSWLVAQDYAKATIQKVYKSAFKYFYDWLVLQDTIKPTHIDALRLSKAMRSLGRRKSKPFPRIPQRDDDLKMIEAAHQMSYPAPIQERNLAIIEYLFSSGCRANEAAGLRVRDLDLAERSAVVTGKGDKQRRVFFSTDAARALREYFRVRGHQGLGEPVFCRHDRGAGEKVKPLTTATLRNVVAEVAKAAGIDPHQFTPHAFRHAFAIRLLQETSNLAVVQDLLGHSDPGTTRVYATIYPEELKQAHREVFR